MIDFSMQPLRIVEFTKWYLRVLNHTFLVELGGVTVERLSRTIDHRDKIVLDAMNLARMVDSICQECHEVGCQQTRCELARKILLVEGEL